MLKGKRNTKLAFEIRQVVAEALLQKVRDPRIGFVTVTEADLSPDLKYARVYVSVLGREKQKEGAVIALNYARGFFQKEIATKLKLRHTPKVEFALDVSISEGAKIDHILKKIEQETGGGDLPAVHPGDGESFAERTEESE